MNLHNHPNKTNCLETILSRSENSDNIIPKVNSGISRRNDNRILVIKGKPNIIIGLAFFRELRKQKNGSAGTSLQTCASRTVLNSSGERKTFSLY